MNCKNYTIYLLAWIGILFTISIETPVALAQESISVSNKIEENQFYKIPVGVFVTSLYDLDFTKGKYSVTAWVWATYYPNKNLPSDYAFFNHIEIVNAREWELSSTEHYTINHTDGSQRSMTKFTATLNQNWDVRYFPFDKQTLKIVIESVELDSSMIKFIPDIKNSQISDDFSLDSWYISPLQLEGLDYQYPSTFGDPSGVKGVYPRIVVKIPIERQGLRIFFTIFLGFFVSYIIITILSILAPSKDMLLGRLSLIMTALFAAVGNKYTIDTLFPSQAHFSLSDLVQVTTFAIVAMGLMNTVMIAKRTRTGKDELAYKFDYWISILIIPTYPAIILAGVFFALYADIR